jgi:RHS repeat-associated protein
MVRSLMGALSALWLAGAVVMAPGTAQAAWMPATGVQGWCGLNAGGGCTYFGTPMEACYWQAINWGGTPIFQGYVDDPYGPLWYAKLCKWKNTTIGSAPAEAYFTCLSGYTRQAPDHCVKDGEDWPKVCPTCATPYPIDVLTGNKTFRADDFTTADGGLSLARSFNSLMASGAGASISSLPPALANWAFDWAFELHIASAWDSGSYVIGVIDPRGGVYQFQRNSTTGLMQPFVNATYPLPQPGYVLTFTGTWPSNLSTIRNASTTWTLKDPQDRTWYLQTFADPSSGKYVVARPTSMVDRNGRTLTFAYGGSTELVSITDGDGKQITFDWNYLAGVPHGVSVAHLPGGATVNYFYDTISTSGVPSNDRLARVEYRDALGVVQDKTFYLYQDNRYPLFVTDIQDKNTLTRWSVTYDGVQRAVTSSAPGDAEKFSVAYGTAASAFTRTVTNPLGKVSTYNFSNGVGTYGVKLNSITTAATTNTPASTRSITYGTDKFVASVTDEEGRVTAYTNNARGLPTQIVEAQGTTSARTTTITWHATLNVPTQIVAPGLTTDFIYNTGGQLTSKTETDTTTFTTPYSTNGRTRTWTYSYNTDGQLASVDGPLAGAGDAVSYGYTTAGFLASITDEVGHATTVTSWDNRGNPLTLVDANGVSTGFTYDIQGRPLTATIDPGASQSQYGFEYTAMGDVSKITLPGGGYLTYTYNDARQLTQVANDRGQSVTLTPNLMDGPTTSVIKAGSTTTAQQSFAYDELGRLIQAIGAGSQTWGFGYDKVDNLKSVTDARGKLFQTGFDPLNRAITQTDPESHTIQLAYAANDNLTSHKDGRTLETTRIVDGFGRTIQEVSPDRGTRIYSYDLADHLTKVIDGDGVEVDYAYDAAGRLQSATYPGHSAETITYAYDATASGNKGVGRLTGVTEESGSTALTYDEQGRVIIDAKTIQAKSYTVGYAYDANGQVTTITLPSGRTVSYARAPDGLVTGITTKATPLSSADNLATSVAYLPFGPLQGLTYGNGLTLTRTYDQNYWLTGTQVAAAGTTRLNLSFGRNANGQLTGVTDNASSGRGAAFDYTDAGRLNVATGPWGADTFTYDAAGNRTDKARTIGGVTAHESPVPALASNRVTQVKNGAGAVIRTLTYNPGGDLAQDAITSGATYNFTYNARKRLVAAGAASGDQGSYGYDYQGRRVWRTIVGATTTVKTHYVFDPAGHLLAEHDGATGAVLREYVWLDDMPVAVIDSTGASPVTYFIHTGQIEEPLVMTDAAQNKVWDAYVEPFGQAQVFGTPSAGLDLRLPGQFTEAESGGLHQNWNRNYDASLGRYIEADPLGIEAGQNLYAYVDGDPLDDDDVLGLQSNVLPTPEGPVLIPPLYSPAPWARRAPTDPELLLNEILAKSEVAIRNRIARQGQYVRAKQFCDEQPRSSGDQCRDLSRLIDHAKRCIFLYQEWDKNWLPGRHSNKISTWQNRLDNLKKIHRLQCTTKCQK